MPKVSVIVPIYNVEKFLRECLDSLINQTLDDIEIICINDGSSDKSQEILEEYKNKDNRITVLTQPNLGAGAARNNGLKHAKGEYIAFLDGDDFYENDFCEKMYNKAILTNSDIVVCKADSFDNTNFNKSPLNHALVEKCLPNINTFNYLDLNTHIFNTFQSWNWNKLFNKLFLYKYEIHFQEIHRTNDLYFTYKALILADKISVVKESLVNYRIGLSNNSQSTNDAYPIDFLSAFIELRKFLLGVTVFEKVKKSYYRELKSSIKYNLKSLTCKSSKLLVLKFLKEKELDLGISNAPIFYKMGLKLMLIKVISVKTAKSKVDTQATIIKENCIKSTPKVSVIVPVFNVEKYLNRSLTALTSQTLKEIEIICINDGSTDNSLDILKEYAQKDDRLKIIDLKENFGAAVARNKGLDVAQGEYLGFVDPDDTIDLNFYEELYNCAKKNNADISKGGVINIREDGEQKESNIIDLMKKTKFAFKHEWWSAIYKTQMINDNGIRLPQDCRKGHDGIFLLLAIINAKRIITTKDTYYYYFRRNNSLDANTIPYKSICSAMRVKSRMLKYLNDYKVYETDKKYYTYAYSIRLNSIFYNLFQNDSFRARYLCLKTFLEGFQNCKMPQKLKKQFQYKWMIDAIERNDKKSLLPTFLNAKACADLKYPYLKNDKIIISLTSYPARIITVCKTIKSLLNQTIQPKKIVLALGEDKFPNKENDLPENLKSLLSDKFEILWTPKDLRSYTKLVPTLQKYPNNIIVTVDDDIIYKNDMLETLYEAYKKQPNLIHCHRAHRITYDKKKNMCPYKNWVWSVKKVKPSFNNFLTGVGAVLYPPYVLNKDVFNIELFQKLAPMADDIWFWAMAVLNNTKINVIKNNYSKLSYIDGTQENCLWKTNVDESQNDEQMKNVLDYYPQIFEKLDKRNFKNITFLQSLFSTTNLPSLDGKWNKVIYIMGLKFSFRNKKKEARTKALEESELNNELSKN